MTQIYFVAGVLELPSASFPLSLFLLGLFLLYGIKVTHSHVPPASLVILHRRSLGEAETSQRHRKAGEKTVLHMGHTQKDGWGGGRDKRGGECDGFIPSAYTWSLSLTRDCADLRPPSSDKPYFCFLTDARVR